MVSCLVMFFPSPVYLTVLVGFHYRGIPSIMRWEGGGARVEDRIRGLWDV